MISNFEAVILGIIQGLTEYLPVSSSGHLVITHHLFGLQEPAIFFDVILHLGTLLVVIWYYRADIKATLIDTYKGVAQLFHGESPSKIMDQLPGFRMAWFVFLGSIPTGIIGIGFRRQFEEMFASTELVGVMLIFTGLLLFATRFVTDKKENEKRITWRLALAVGLAQGLAITPGISRSGATIAIALLLGVEREMAARLSFFLLIPALTGAILISVNDASMDVSTTALTLGFVSSLIVGYFSLALLVNFVKRGRLSWFAYYCVGAGAFTYFFIG
ncbi:Undecaprenyl-diphosphatase [hydrothermal vent metagenome]|uniref:Undecaprenyl-diphosphatase n=1 Tax=hydrothermal vent metagenome TaxID=652676 RepID=A0A3B1CMG2_9ZZZZ